MPERRRPTWGRLASIAVLALTAAACSDDSETATETTVDPGDAPVTTSDAEATTTTTTGAPTESPFTITVEDAGEEPRRELRLQAEPGDVDRLTQRQEISIEIRADGQVQGAPGPVTEIDLTSTVVDVADDRIVARGTYDDVRVLDTPGVDPATVEQMRQLMSGFLDATAETTYSTRAGVLDVQIEGLELSGAGAAVAEQLASSITDTAESLGVPFPEEAVGVGARWRVEAEVVLAGLPVQISSVVTLTEASDGGAAGTIEQTMRFVPGEVEVMGTRATVVSGELSGGGPIRWDFGALLPRSDVSISGTSILEAQGTRIEQYQEQRITISDR